MRKRPIVLGRLEIAVLEELWDAGPADVTAMHDAVGEVRGLARNTVQSTLERLVRKELAERRKVGRAYEYRARVSRSEWLGDALEELVNRVSGVDPSLLVSTFVDFAERTGTATLDELEALVRERRQRTEDES